LGALLPVLVVAATPPRLLIPATVLASLLCLLGLGGLSARIGGAAAIAGALRVAFWSALAMAVTAGVGAAIGALR
jgi:VIT1/CCC1 family predicted Fe2+/Mn2+ transporter